MIPPELEKVLVSTPDTLSGAIRFVNTRVPVQVFLDTLLDGSALDDFLSGFPNVTREQAEAVIRWDQNFSRRIFGLEAPA